MPLEIEHKFLVKGCFNSYVTRSTRIVQGYLSSLKERTVRVRIYGDRAYFTVTGPTRSDGLTRYEFEQEIPLAEAEQMLQLCCEPGIIEKVRHIVPYAGHVWEIDEFRGDNVGLILAEIEVQSADETFEIPPFVGKEVTGNEKYYNSYLSNHPFTEWNR